MENPKTLVFLGRSGSGKGTQIKPLIEKLSPGLLIYTGKLFREFAKKETQMAKRAKEVLDRGGLQPAWLATLMWKRELADTFKGNENVVFDGSPRITEEAQEIDKVMAWLGRGRVEAVYIDVSREEAMERLIKRGRSDDTIDAIKERMEWFDEEVAPTVEYYRKDGRLYHIDGSGSVDEVFVSILKALNLE